MDPTQNHLQENFTPQQLKTILSLYSPPLKWLEQKGREVYGDHFRFFERDKFLLFQLICYFLKDEKHAVQFKIHLHKGILLNGPVGCGKTSLMFLMRFLESQQNRFVLRSCREISFDFIKDGYNVIQKYSRNNFQKNQQIVYCFDDLGTENNLKYFGNECNVMAEILLSRYDLFISHKTVTHLTTNLSASEIENAYGNRVRSRMREMLNLISFDKNTTDKRK